MDSDSEPASDSQASGEPSFEKDSSDQSVILMEPEPTSCCQASGDPASDKGEVAQWIKDGFDLVTLIDQGKVRDAEGTKRYVDCAGDSASLGWVNDRNQTPLMLACIHGRKEIVRFLLDNGADPNVKCTDLGNSALHCACQRDRYVEYTEEKRLDIIEIVEMLLNYGAVWQFNDDGFSPAYVAAWNGFKEIVDYFSSSSCVGMPLAEKVKAYELMGVAQAVLAKDNAIAACESFHVAATLLAENESNNCPIAHHVNTEMDSWFSNIINKEKVSDDEDMEIKRKAYLIGLQCVPYTVKWEYNIWDECIHFAECVLDDCKNTEACYELLAALIKEEMICNTMLGTVFRIMYENGQPSTSMEKSVQRLFPRLLEVYADALPDCQSRSQEQLNEIIEYLGHILFDFAYFHSQSSYLLQCLPVVGRILVWIKKWQAEDASPTTSGNKESVTLVFFDAMACAMWEDVYSGQSKKTRNRLEYVIYRLLHYNGFDPVTDSSLLQTTLEVSPVARDADFIHSICRVLIRYGCSTTNASIEEEDEDDIELEALLRHTKPVTLEEVASRVILRNKIPYREVLPAVICEKIEGWPWVPGHSDLDSSTESDSY